MEADEQEYEPKLTLRGGADENDDDADNEINQLKADTPAKEERKPVTAPKPSEGIDEDEDEGGDDPAPPKTPQLILGKAKAKDLESEEGTRKNRKWFIAILLCILFIAFVILLIFLFKPDNTPLSRSVEVEIPSDAPTQSPTPAQTSSPTPAIDNQTTTTPAPVATPKPSASPTVANVATDSPTFTSIDPVSLLTCEELLVSPELHVFPQGVPFKENYTMPDGRQLCGDTYVGFPDSNTRNPWTAKQGQKNCWKYGYADGTAICEDVGARRCTADELQFGASQGTGCNGDNVLLWTSTSCTSAGGVDGFYQINIELKHNSTVWFKCETNLAALTLARCCADHESN